MKRKELMKSLEKLYPAVATKAPVEEMECFRFTDHSITSTDGLVQVQVTLPGSTGLDCAVPARKLYTLLGSISQDDISLDLQENELRVKAGRLRGRITTRPDGGILDNLDFNIKEWLPIPDGMLRGLRVSSFAVSKDASRGVMCGIQVNKNTCTATDSIRIVQDTGPENYTDIPVVIPPRIVTMLSKYKNVEGWAVKAGVVYFKAGSVVIGAKCLMGEYPNPAQFLAEEPKNSVKFPDGVKQAVDQHNKMLADDPDDDRAVLMSFDGKTLILSSGDGSYGLEQEFDLAEDVAKMEFLIHPGLLSDALARSATMKYNEGGVFVRFDADKFVCLVCVEKPSSDEDDG